MDPRYLGGDTGPRNLFTQSTISKDDTQGAASRERRLLTPGPPPPLPMNTTGYPPGGGPTNPFAYGAGPGMAPPSMGPPGRGPPGHGEPPPPAPSQPPVSVPGRSASDHDSSKFPTSIERGGRWRDELTTRRGGEISPIEESDELNEPSAQGVSLSSSDARTGYDLSRHKTALSGKPKLASALGAIADEYLELDVLDDNRHTSQYVAFLLDVIQTLQSRLAFQDHDGQESDEKDEDSLEQPEKPDTPRFQVLHRVFCGTASHNHDAAIYEDIPITTRQTQGLLAGEELLRGKVEITDVEGYLRRHPAIHFVVFKEHRCNQTPTFTSSWIIRRGLESGPDHFNGTREAISTRQERMQIVSPLLKKAINTIAEFKPDYIVFYGPVDDSTEMEAPYNFLFHHRRKLRQLADDSELYRPSLDVLLGYLQENFEQEYLEAERLFEKGVVPETHIERLFRPNQVVVTKDQEVQIALSLNEWPVKKFNHLQFSGWRWYYNGRHLRRQPWFGKMELGFLDDKEIRELAICPIDFVQEDSVKGLKERGKQFWSMRSQRLVSYDGWDHHHDYFYSKERFMIDMATYSKMHGMRAFQPSSEEPIEFDDMPQSISQDDDVTDTQMLLLPATTHGYSLREKKWVSLNVGQMGDVVWNKKAFDRLVLEKDTKELLRALIDVRMSDTKKLDDLVVGKGNGLIMLLHGSPGTGKSLTAESVAEFAEKPLYRVTCGDIGTDAQAVEKYLETILYLGKIWDCVLLLDEADVFLEERSVSDLRRNSLVSVFLRVLEYYEGIMILTSNRVGTFDEAFQSRIRVALRYEPLTSKSRKAIWRNFFEMLEDDDEEIKVNIRDLEGRLNELAAFKINGRQIRNVLLTARQLALHKKESLEWKHLSQVMKLSNDFNKYLNEIKGHSDEDWAKSQALR
ncbi:hypothetical protein BJ170DRAFT_462939 [Xylariales sp. AK1849]|nr:hypothetical protein BJ170DRAFT_462939 [Xylariales sp. AK1849]